MTAAQWVAGAAGGLYRVETWGCQMNVLDGERMAGQLEARGFTRAADGEDADVIVLNTCHVRDKADHKVYSELGVLAAAQPERPDLVIGVAGCVAQAEGERIFERAPWVDFVAGHGRGGEGRRDRRAGAPGAPPRGRPGAAGGVPGVPVSPDHAGLGLPGVRDRDRGLRSVLHLLRRAVHARAGAVPPGGGDPARRPPCWSRRATARSRCSARPSTPIGSPKRASVWASSCAGRPASRVSSGCAS